MALGSCLAEKREGRGGGCIGAGRGEGGGGEAPATGGRRGRGAGGTGGLRERAAGKTEPPAVPRSSEVGAGLARQGPAFFDERSSSPRSGRGRTGTGPTSSTTAKLIMVFTRYPGCRHLQKNKQTNKQTKRSNRFDAQTEPASRFTSRYDKVDHRRRHGGPDRVRRLPVHVARTCPPP